MKSGIAQSMQYNLWCVIILHVQIHINVWLINFRLFYILGEVCGDDIISHASSTGDTGQYLLCWRYIVHLLITHMYMYMCMYVHVHAFTYTCTCIVVLWSFKVYGLYSYIIVFPTTTSNSNTCIPVPWRSHTSKEKQLVQNPRTLEVSYTLVPVCMYCMCLDVAWSSGSLVFSRARSGDKAICFVFFRRSIIIVCHCLEGLNEALFRRLRTVGVVYTRNGGHRDTFTNAFTKRKAPHISRGLLSRPLSL